MARTKYKFNPDSLSFDKVKLGIGQILVKIFAYIVASVLLSFLYFLIFYFVSKSDVFPKLSRIDFNKLLHILLYLLIVIFCLLFFYSIYLLFYNKFTTKIETIHDILNKIKNENKNKHNFFIEVRDDFKFSVQNFLNSFNLYARKAKGAFVNFQVYNAEKGLICAFEAKNENEKKQIEVWFNEYVTFIYKQVDDISISFENNANDHERIIIEQLIKSTVRTFIEQCNLVSPDSLKNGVVFKMLDENTGIRIENIKIDIGNQQFSDNISNSEMKIRHLNIKGGSQQFADKITISNFSIESNAEQIRNVIDKYAPEGKRVALHKSLEMVCKKNNDSKSRKKSIDYIHSFLNSAIKEFGKEVITEGFNLIM